MPEEKRNLDFRASIPPVEIEDAYERLGGYNQSDIELVKAARRAVSSTSKSLSVESERARVFGGPNQAREMVAEIKNQLLPALRHIIQQRTESGTNNDVLNSLYAENKKLERLVSGQSLPKLTTGIDPSLSLTRQDVRALRSRMSMGEDVFGTSEYNELASKRSGLEDRIGELSSQYSGARRAYDKDPSRENLEVVNTISRELSYATNLRQELVNVLDMGAKKQESVFNKFTSFVSQVISISQIGQMVSRFAVSEPYKYGTQAQLNVISQQGAMGSLVGGALGAVEQRNQELKQMGFATGVGFLATAGSMFAGGAKGMAAAAAATGLGISAVSLAGYTDDILKNIPGVKKDDEIMAQDMAQRLSDPSRLVSEFATSRAGLFAVGESAEDNFGFSTNFSELGPLGTGNSAFDRMLAAPGGSALRSFGYDREKLGSLLSSTSLALRGPNLEGMAAQAGLIGEAYGIGPEAVLGGMQTAQRFGSENAIGSYAKAMNVFSEGATPGTGDISNYSMNVLVPALLKATESSTMRNLARSTDELEDEVNSFGRYLFQSDDTRLGQLSRTNPEIISRILGGLQESASLGMNNMPIAALDIMLGSSMADIFMGRATVSANRFNYALGQSGITASTFGSTDEMLNSQQGIGLMRMLSGLFPNISMPDLVAISELGIKGNLFDAVSGEFNYDSMPSDLADRLREAEGSSLGKLSATMAEQVDKFLNLSSSLIEELTQLQASVNRVFGSAYIQGVLSRFFTDTQKSVDGFAERMNNQQETLEEIARLTELDHALLIGGFASFEDRIRAMKDEGLLPEGYSQMGAMRAHFGENYSRAALLLQDNPTMQDEYLALVSGSYNGGRNSTPIEEEALNALYNKYSFQYDRDLFEEGFSTGGYTGSGGTHSITGFVHAGEYVISAGNVEANRGVLDRIQSGEVISTSEAGGSTTYVTLKVHGMSQEEIVSTARRVTEDYIYRNRLNHT